MQQKTTKLRVLTLKSLVVVSDKLLEQELYASHNKELGRKVAYGIYHIARGSVENPQIKTVVTITEALEKIVNERMAIMQKIKSSSSKLYRLINSDQYEEMLELNETLLHSASEFKDFYPENSQAKGASDNIWSDRETFNEYNQNFVDDIEMISLSIELEDKEEEKLVNGLTNGLTTVFVDNPKLMDYLKEKIKEG